MCKKSHFSTIKRDLCIKKIASILTTVPNRFGIKIRSNSLQPIAASRRADARCRTHITLRQLHHHSRAHHFAVNWRVLAALQEDGLDEHVHLVDVVTEIG